MDELDANNYILPDTGVTPVYKTDEPPLSEQSIIPQETHEERGVGLNLNDIVTKPQEFVKTAVSANIKGKIDTDSAVKDKIDKTASFVVDNTVEQIKQTAAVDTQKSYYDRKTQSLNAMGVADKTDKWKMRIVGTIYDFWFVIFYLTVGFFFLAPLVVLLNIASAISKKTTKDNSSKFGIFATIIAVIIFVAYCVGWGFLIYYIVNFGR